MLLSTCCWAAWSHLDDDHDGWCAVARLVVARTNQLQATAGPQPLPHKLYRSTAIREVEQLWEDKFRLKNLKAFAKAIHHAMKSDPKFAEGSLAEWKASI